MMKNKTLIIGASTNPERYSYKAAEKLLENNHDIYMIGNKPRHIFYREITQDLIPYPDVDTVTMYISTKIQPKYYDYILSLHPRRVIFNPGTENPKFAETLHANKIQTEEACTLVMLSTNAY
jgi:uncharacterized protein